MEFNYLVSYYHILQQKRLRMQEDNENELYAMHEKLNAYTMHHVLDGKKYARAEVTLSMIMFSQARRIHMISPHRRAKRRA